MIPSLCKAYRVSSGRDMIAEVCGGVQIFEGSRFLMILPRRNYYRRIQDPSIVVSSRRSPAARVALSISRVDRQLWCCGAGGRFLFWRPRVPQLPRKRHEAPDSRAQCCSHLSLPSFKPAPQPGPPASHLARHVDSPPRRLCRYPAGLWLSHSGDRCETLLPERLHMAC